MKGDEGVEKRGFLSGGRGGQQQQTCSLDCRDDTGSREHLYAGAATWQRINGVTLHLFYKFNFLCVDSASAAMRLAGALLLVGILASGADFPHAAQGSSIRFTNVAAAVGLDSFRNIAG